MKGEYGKTPVPVDPTFREQITGSPVETPYDTSNYKRQDNPVLEEFGGVQLAKDEKDSLLMELFPAVASGFLRKKREEEFNAQAKQATPAEEAKSETKQEAAPTTEKTVKGHIMECPMPGSIMRIMVKEGDVVKKNDSLLILESMKMENDITSDYNGTVLRIYVKQGDAIQAGAPMIEIG